MDTVILRDRGVMCVRVSVCVYTYCIFRVSTFVYIVRTGKIYCHKFDQGNHFYLIGSRTISLFYNRTKGLIYRTQSSSLSRTTW